MNQPFIRNHQYNHVKKQTDLLQHTVSTVSDPKVVESVRDHAVFRILEAFPDASDDRKQLLGNIAGLRLQEEFRQYLEALEPWLSEFPLLTAKQLQKLFPKIKKLKLPDWDTLDLKRTTYLGWTDIAADRMFLIYPLDGEMAGIEGRFTQTNKGVCFLCNRHEELVLFTAVTKTKPAHASPDYYKAIGNYMCLDSAACNRNITDVTVLENFFRSVLGR